MLMAMAMMMLAQGAPQTVSAATIGKLARGDVPGLYLWDVRQYPLAIQDQLVAEAAEDEVCRGASDAFTDAACARRDAMVKELGRKGWCWGPDNAIEADRRWMRVGRNCHL